MSKETGGPAFPAEEIDDDQSVSQGKIVVKEMHLGMTLRDYFAAHCPEQEIQNRMPGTVGEMADLLKSRGIIGAWTEIIRTYGPKDVAKLRVVFRYEYADAMIAERNK